MNKRILLYTMFFVVLTGFITSCELLEECGTCEQVIVRADGTEERGVPTPYCGEALKEKKNSQPDVIGGDTYYWDCY
jgi:hypothetical protein